MSGLNEATIEAATLESFEGLGYASKNSLLIAPGEPAAEHDSFGEVALVGRLREAIGPLIPAIFEEAQVNMRQDRILQLERSANP